MAEPIYRVCLEKDTMVFSAAHFITFNRDICESLHGHNYRVKCEVAGTLDENGYVCDFIARRDALANIVKSLDHQVVLPTLHDRIRVEVQDREVEVRFEDRRWVFPRGDCQLLPVANTTAELLAGWIAEQLIEQTKAQFGDNLVNLTVAVDENRGQWGTVTVPWPSP